MIDPGPIETVAVVGGGLVAWSAAAALKRRIPSLEVALIAAPVDPAALADRMISTLPSIHGFHQDIGLTDEDTIVRAQSGFRLGTLFDGWADGLPAYVHAYGPYGAAYEGVAFHQLWLRDREVADLPPFDRFSQAAELARSGRAPQQMPDEIECGLQLSLERYGSLIRAYALHLGVSEQGAFVADVALRSSDGFIESLTLDDGRCATADLFVDCTGPGALLRSKLGGAFSEWSSWLPCDRLTVTESAPLAHAVVMDRVTAFESGWRWTASSPLHAVSGEVYSSAHLRDKDGDPGPAINLRQGRWSESWVRNCVAIGDAAVAVEPLEWTNLHLAHSQIDRIVAMMPGRDCAPIELTEFNRQCSQEADRVRDFLCLHYICARRRDAFWKEAANMTPPASLAHTLALFAERGRLPYYDEETFTRDSWLAVLLGQGFAPRRIDPMADLVPPPEADRAIKAMRRSAQSLHPSPATSAAVELNSRGAR